MADRDWQRRHLDLNAATAANAAAFQSHRRRVTQLVASHPGGTLALFGAGNCNDVDLGVLAQKFATIDLLDIDAAAMRRAVADRNEGQIHAHSCDLSGLAAVLAAETLDVDALVAAASSPAPLPVANVDVVASCCLLSQMVLSVASQMGPTHPHLLDVVRALRTSHLRSLVDCLRPGGWGFLITDVVSSDTVPDLRDAPGKELQARMTELVRRGNFFTGMNPFIIGAAFDQAPLAATVTEVARYWPWVWSMSETRRYLVFAVSFCRRMI